jgi:ATP sulfurylase
MSVATPILITSKEKEIEMFRNENETLAVAHLWAIEVPYEGVWSSMGLFTTEEQAQAVIDADDFLNGYAFAVPMALPTA